MIDVIFPQMQRNECTKVFNQHLNVHYLDDLITGDRWQGFADRLLCLGHGWILICVYSLVYELSCTTGKGVNVSLFVNE